MGASYAALRGGATGVRVWCGAVARSYGPGGRLGRRSARRGPIVVLPPVPVVLRPASGRVHGSPGPARTAAVVVRSRTAARPYVSCVPARPVRGRVVTEVTVVTDRRIGRRPADMHRAGTVSTCRRTEAVPGPGGVCPARDLRRPTSAGGRSHRVPSRGPGCSARERGPTGSSTRPPASGQAPARGPAAGRPRPSRTLRCGQPRPGAGHPDSGPSTRPGAVRPEHPARGRTAHPATRCRP